MRFVKITLFPGCRCGSPALGLRKQDSNITGIVRAAGTLFDRSRV